MKSWMRRLRQTLHNVAFKYRLANVEQDRIDSELRIAREIQFSLAPPSFPEYSEWREFDLHAYLSPVREVGGDFYDYCRLDANRLAIVVGDVSGKGVPASLYMAVCLTAMKTLIREAKSPGELLTRVNNILVRDSSANRYVTCAVFFIDMPTGRCEYALAGHPAPLRRHNADGTTVAIDTPRSSFVGLKGGLSYPTGEALLLPGDTLLLYTDGVTEARNASGDELDVVGLTTLFDKAVTKTRCRDIVEALQNDIGVHIGPRKRDDDVTLMAFRYWGPGGKKTVLRGG